MNFFIRYIIALVAFSVIFAGGASAMEHVGFEAGYAYATFGAIWGMLWVAVLFNLSD